jgi:glutamate dehydrogenase
LPEQEVNRFHMVDTESSLSGLPALVSAARAHVADVDLAMIDGFVPRYFAEIDVDELAHRNPIELGRAAAGHLEFGRTRLPGRTVARVVAVDGSSHSWLQLVTDDAPFLVDSIRLVLERHGLGIHLMIHPMLDVQRDATGALVAADGGPIREAWTMLEIDHVDAAEVSALEAEVDHAVALVHTAVGDQDAIRSRVHLLADSLEDLHTDGHTVAEAEQVAKLLGWLARQNFVFLGAVSCVLDDGSLEVVAGSQLGLLRGSDSLDPAFAGGDQLVSIARADAEVAVHRRARPTCIAVRKFDHDGRVIGEDRFIGLFAAAAYRSAVGTIPLIRERVSWVLARSKVDPSSHTGRALRTVLETFPRDELFEIGRDELAEVAAEIVGLQDRAIVRVLELRAPVSGWQTLAVYLPRVRLTPEMPEQIATHVASSMGATRYEFDSLVGATALARVTVAFRRAQAVDATDLDRLTGEIDQLTRRWEDRLGAELTALVGESEAVRLGHQLGDHLPTDYAWLTSPSMAAHDLRVIDRLLTSGESTATSVVRAPDGADDERRFRLYRVDGPLTLAELLPLLDQLGLQALDERPSTLRFGDRTVSLYDVGVRLGGGVSLSDSTELEATFRHLLDGAIESDGLNRLVLAAGLTGRQVELVRAYAKYLRQTAFPFSQQYVEATLVKHPSVARLLVELFEALFDPSATDRAERSAVLVEKLDVALNAIPSLDEDRICRTLSELIGATLRTNAYRPAVDGGKRNVLAMKLDPALVPDLPLPRPMFEIWVCSPRVEGVHLRGGRIARGGLRWSDRREDFRTEVLGLMKAQMVKNAVIVPGGAKGGFVVKRPPADGDALRSEVVACYQDFVAGLLDVTDNLVAQGGSTVVVAPSHTVRYDGDDPYLVVAADKGTATFSDIANAISADYDFWLGDAFASGGSVGYDHKAMGITARGAWESVRRHAAVLGRNADTDRLTVVGIGDMSGDVFGNGLLRSPHVQLIAAFDHRHIFLDPEPEPAASFAERLRLFGLPRSSWTDYDKTLISVGGGVFARTEKSITLSAQIRQRLGVSAAEMTPNELLTAILSAPVDLLWNGGIGTYVKASAESHAEVGDRANDAIRVDGNMLRCRMVGEGGNLGFTQRGRVEYALNGGLINTDAIDNSAGVDCSDHEVNIKILLNGCVQRGELAVEARNVLLASMSDEVGELVLDDNRAQTMALTIARRQALPMINVHTRYLHVLEAEGWLNRALEFLPTDRQLAERQAAGQGLTTPEFAVLLAYTKNANVAEIVQSDLPDNAYLERDLVRYFPSAMRTRFLPEIRNHQLRREIVATQVINQMVNLSGISFDHRMTEEVGAGLADIARAWVVSRDVTGLPQLWDEIEQLDGDVKLDVQLDLLLEARRMTERGVMWFLRHRRPPIDLTATVAEFRDPMEELSVEFADVLRGQLAALTHSTWASRLASGVPDVLAERSAVWPVLHTAFDVIELAARHQADRKRTAGHYWELFDELDVLWLWDGIGSLPRSTRWETQARSALRDDLMSGLSDLTGDVLRSGVDVPTWLANNERAVGRVTTMFNEVRRSDTFDLTTLTVGVRQLRNLALATQ